MDTENIEETIDSTNDTDTETETNGSEESSDSEQKFSDRETKLYARMKRAEQEAKELKARQASLQTKPTQSDDTDDFDVRETVKSLQLSEKKRSFGYEHGLSPEETDHLFKLNANPSKELLDDPFVKGGIQALRAKKRIADATPSSTGRVFQSGGKTWDKMESKEKSQNFEARMKALVESKRK